MDDNFDSLIYILITIVAFVISALGKKKKKRSNVPPMQAVRESQTEKKKTVFPDIQQLIREEMGMETDEYSDDPYVFDNDEKEEPEKEKPLDFVPEEMLDDKPDKPYSVEYEDNDVLKSGAIQDSDISKQASEEETVMDDFDLQEAIIYSEIINRKEY